jgi:ABC-type multidrug transport system ATPase subunit
MSEAIPLVVASVTKRYADRTVLDAIGLRVEPGQTVVLRGPNGAGKSTLLGCIAGTVIPDEGRIAIGGHDLAREPLRARAALRYLPQEPEVPPGLSGRELLGFFADVYADPAGAERAAAFLGFGEALERFATTYSVGMRRLLMFAALLPGHGRLWVLDEPFAGVDADGRAKIRGALERALHEGAGVVLAAHDRDVQDVEPLSPVRFDVAAANDPVEPPSPVRVDVAAASDPTDREERS